MKIESQNEEQTKKRYYLKSVTLVNAYTKKREI